MATSEFGTGKSIVVLAIVVGCFAVLWPKIFYPMMQAAFSMTSPKPDDDEQAFRPRDRPPHLQPGIMDTHMRQRREEAHHSAIKEGRPFPHPSSRQPVKPQTKTGGAMSIIMPVYTIGIVVFFVYTVMKLVFKKNPESEKKPLVKDFHMDPEYHKFVCEQTTSEKRTSVKTKRAQEQTKSSEQIFEERNEDYEIYKLRKKLEETEIAMERIMKQMGAVSNCLSKACLLKDGTFTFKESKDAEEASQLFSTAPEMMKTVGETVNKSKPDAVSVENVTDGVDSTDISPPLSKPTDVKQASPDTSSDCSADKPGNEQQTLKRDSSINSENSSFEMLSQSINGSSNGYVMADLDSEVRESEGMSDKGALEVTDLESADKTSVDDSEEHHSDNDDDDDDGGNEVDDDNDDDDDDDDDVDEDGGREVQESFPYTKSGDDLNNSHSNAKLLHSKAKKLSRKQ